MCVMLDPENIPLSNAYELIVSSHASFFLSGKAGTGKTTMIRNAMAAARKNCIVVAPTGIAALSAGGHTIHSFFGLPLGVIGPGVRGRVKAQYCEIIRQADAIIIDEVSMVRCDVMDALERTLRYVMGNTEPFGGLQMVFVGDLFQLEPVVTDEDLPELEKLYGVCRYHFFHAKCMEYVNLPKIYLEKVYRQSDSAFIDLLDKVRDGSAVEDDIERINDRMVGSDDTDGFAITLTSYNADADRINRTNLNSLPGPSRVYKASYEGDCSGLKSAVEDSLELKVGARVVFIVNDIQDKSGGRWMNGTMGTVTALHEDGVEVAKEDGSAYKVENYTWHISNLVFDKDSGTSKEIVTGKITQLPLRHAWAITIHKSQSMTFDRVRIDIGRGAFSCGQVYVGLSRVRSLGGLFLSRPITRQSVLVSDEVLSYSETANDQSVVDLELRIAEMTDDLIARMKFDQAAQVLLEASYEEALAGHTETAEMLADRFFRIVIDDRNIGLLMGNKCSSDWLNAVYAFYSGDTTTPSEYLASLDSYSVDECYLLMRCCEKIGDTDAFNDILSDLLVDAGDSRQSDLPSDRYRKVLLTGARNIKELGEKMALTCLLDLSDDVYRYPGNLMVAREIIFSSANLYLEIIKCTEPFYKKLISYREENFIPTFEKLCEIYTKELRFNPKKGHIFDDLFELLFDYMQTL